MKSTAAATDSSVTVTAMFQELNSKLVKLQRY